MLTTTEPSYHRSNQLCIIRQIKLLRNQDLFDISSEVLNFIENIYFNKVIDNFVHNVKQKLVGN